MMTKPAQRGGSLPSVLRATLVALFVAFAALASGPPPSAAAQHEVYLLTLDGVVTPLSAQYVERGLREAAAARAEVVVLRLDTPGGLASSTRSMVQAVLASPVPVVAYVAPAGAQASSAGMLLTLASNVAAMAPNTSLGATHPSGLLASLRSDSGSQAVDESTVLARSLAEARGRNVDLVGKVVRAGDSLTAREALDQGVVDIVANDLGDLLVRLDGRQASTSQGPTTLRTAGSDVVERPMSLPEQALSIIANPNVAYVLFLLGVVGILVELVSPGAVFPGVTGVVSLVLALVAFGSLPVSVAGIALLVLAIGLVVADLHVGGVGLLAVLGLVAFVLGSLLLYTPLAPAAPAMPEVSVSPWLILAMVVIVEGFLLTFLRAIVESRKAPVVTGVTAMIGQHGHTTSTLSPNGYARVDGEDWSVVSLDGTLEPGTEIVVIAVEGVTLKVRRRPE